MKKRVISSLHFIDKVKLPNLMSLTKKLKNLQIYQITKNKKVKMTRKNTNLNKISIYIYHQKMQKIAKDQKLLNKTTKKNNIL